MARPGNFGGFGGGANMQQLMRQAQKMQQQMQEAQEQLDAAEYEASSGGGMVTVKVSGKRELTSITIDPSNCTPEQMKAWNQAQGDFTQALGRLMVADENYPELRDLQAFQDVRDKLSGAVNRLAEARRQYNEQAKIYNVKVQSFPNNILAGMFGFQPMFYYEAPAGTEEQTTDFSRK